MIPYTREQRIEYARKAAICRRKIQESKENMVLGGFFSLLFFCVGCYYAQKNNIIVPLIAAPGANAALKKLITAESERKQWTQRLRQYE